MKKLIVFALLFTVVRTVVAQEADTANMILDSLKNVEASLRYQHGEITLANGIGTLNIPTGFRYLDSNQSEFVLRDLWGNPSGEGTLGMIVPEDVGVSEVTS